MKESKKVFLEKYKSNLGLNIANTLIVLITFIAMIMFLIIGYVYLSSYWGEDVPISNDWETGDPNKWMNQWAFIILLPVCAIAALAGVISVVASNNKSPIALLVLSTVSTLYKFSYAFVQLGTGQEGINSSVVIGQPIMMVLLLIQVYYWIRWNKVTDEGKFISETFSGKRTKIGFLIIGFIWAAQLGLSIYINFDYGFIAILMDWLGAILYTTAAILMAFGNILCFPFFFLSDMSWLYWTIKDLGSGNIIMRMFAFTTLIEVSAYSALAITGFIQWFKDDFVFVDGRITRKEGRVNGIEDQ